MKSSVSTICILALTFTANVQSMNQHKAGSEDGNHGNAPKQSHSVNHPKQVEPWSGMKQIDFRSYMHMLCLPPISVVEQKRGQLEQQQVAIYHTLRKLQEQNAAMEGYFLKDIDKSYITNTSEPHMTGTLRYIIPSIYELETAVQIIENDIKKHQFRVSNGKSTEENIDCFYDTVLQLRHYIKISQNKYCWIRSYILELLQLKNFIPHMSFMPYIVYQKAQTLKSEKER